MGDWIGELWTDGRHLLVGSATFSGWGGFQRGIIGHLDGSTGTWSTFNTGQNGVPNGYPLSMSECGSYLYIGLFNNNGGVVYMDLNSSSVKGSFTTSVLSNGSVAAVACDLLIHSMLVTMQTIKEFRNTTHPPTDGWQELPLEQTICQQIQFG